MEKYPTLGELHQIWDVSEECDPIYNIDDGKKKRNRGIIIRRNDIAPIRVLDAPVKTKEEIIAEFNDMTIAQRREKFWEIVPRFGIKNISEGGTTKNASAVWRDLSLIDKHIFETLYFDKFRETKEILKPILEAYNLNLQAADNVVSHIVMLGMEACGNLQTDNELTGFLITSGECTNAHALISRLI